VAPPAALAVYDLGMSIPLRSSLPDLVATVRDEYPQVGSVLYCPLLHPVAELQCVANLSPLGTAFVLCRDDLYLPDRWQRIIHEYASLRFRRFLRSAVGGLGKDAGWDREDLEPLLTLLDHAPQLRHVKDVMVVVPGARRRQHLYERLGPRIHASLARLLAMFRVLWAVVLREAGWHVRAISAFLSYRSVEECRLRLGRRVGLRKGDINALTVGEAVIRTSCLCFGDCTTDPVLDPL
jgi:hypothetical protein